MASSNKLNGAYGETSEYNAMIIESDHLGVEVMGKKTCSVNVLPRLNKLVIAMGCMYGSLDPGLNQT